MRDALGLKSFGRSPGPVPPAFAERYQAKENVLPNPPPQDTLNTAAGTPAGQRNKAACYQERTTSPRETPIRACLAGHPKGPILRSAQLPPVSTQAARVPRPGAEEDARRYRRLYTRPVPHRPLKEDPTASKGRDPHQHREEQSPSKIRNTATNIKKTLRLGNGSP